MVSEKQKGIQCLLFWGKRAEVCCYALPPLLPHFLRGDVVLGAGYSSTTCICTALSVRQDFLYRLHDWMADVGVRLGFSRVTISMMRA